MGVGGGCFDKAPCYPFAPRWGSACGSASAPNWDYGHYAGSIEMPKSTAFPALIWEA